MNLNNVDLLQLMTKYMQQDITTQGFCAALTPKLREVANEVILATVYLNLDSLPEDIVNELAGQFHVDFYDISGDMVSKRNLVRNSILIHRKKGTPYAVKKLIQDLFGTAELKEWFDYSGDPYMFRVAVDYSAGVSINIAKFHNLVDSVKNLRSKLELIELRFSANIGISNEIYKRSLTRHTKLRVWTLGNTPFATASEETQVDLGLIVDSWILRTSLWDDYGGWDDDKEWIDDT